MIQCNQVKFCTNIDILELDIHIVDQQFTEDLNEYFTQNEKNKGEIKPF